MIRIHMAYLVICASQKSESIWRIVFFPCEINEFLSLPHPVIMTPKIPMVDGTQPPDLMSPYQPDAIGVFRGDIKVNGREMNSGWGSRGGGGPQKSLGAGWTPLGA